MKLKIWNNSIEYSILDWDDVSLEHIDIEFIKSELWRWAIRWQFEINNNDTEDSHTCSWNKVFIQNIMDLDIELEIDCNAIYVRNMLYYSDDQLDFINWIINQTLNLNKELLDENKWTNNKRLL